MIPTSVVKHFLQDYLLHGAYCGFPSLVRLGGRAGQRVGGRAERHSRRRHGWPAGGCQPTMPWPPPRSTPALQNIVWQEMDSKALKRAYAMQQHQKGVLVRGALLLACLRLRLPAPPLPAAHPCRPCPLARPPARSPGALRHTVLQRGLDPEA